MNPDGSMYVDVSGPCTYISLIQIGLPFGAWFHVGISVATYSEVILSVITWAGVQTTTKSSEFVENPQWFWFYGSWDNFFVTLGGWSPRSDNMEMVDARLYSVALTETDFMAASGAGNCPVDCNGICSGPAFDSCDFISLEGKYTFQTQNVFFKTYTPSSST